jgi:HSP20 family protein
MLAMVRTPAWSTQWSRNAGSWPVNVFENEDGYLVQALVPGVNPEELEITAQPGNYLVIAGTVKPNVPENARAVWNEFGNSQFRRAFALPLPFDADRAATSYHNGLLEVILPKKEEAKPRQIKVLANGQS